MTLRKKEHLKKFERAKSQMNMKKDKVKTSKTKPRKIENQLNQTTATIMPIDDKKKSALTPLMNQVEGKYEKEPRQSPKIQASQIDHTVDSSNVSSNIKPGLAKIQLTEDKKPNNKENFVKMDIVEEESRSEDKPAPISLEVPYFSAVETIDMQKIDEEFPETTPPVLGALTPSLQSSASDLQASLPFDADESTVGLLSFFESPPEQSAPEAEVPPANPEPIASATLPVVLPPGRLSRNVSDDISTSDLDLFSEAPLLFAGSLFEDYTAESIEGMAGQPLRTPAVTRATSSRLSNYISPEQMQEDTEDASFFDSVSYFNTSK